MCVVAGTGYRRGVLMAPQHRAYWGQGVALASCRVGETDSPFCAKWPLEGVSGLHAKPGSVL